MARNLHEEDMKQLVIHDSFSISIS